MTITPTIDLINGQRLVSLQIALVDQVLAAVVPLFAASESMLTIQGTGLKDATVHPRGVHVGGIQDGPLRAHSASDTELRVYVPSMRELQSTNSRLFDVDALTYAYHRNAIALPFVITVRNGDGTPSVPIVLAVTLPPPSVGAPGVKGNIVTIGSLSGRARDETDYLGGPAKGDDTWGGEIRWYGASALKDPPAFDIELYLPALDTPDLKDPARKFWDWLFAAAKNPTVPQIVWDNLAAVRSSGMRLEPLHWHDDGVKFAIPQDTPFGTAGVAVIWRDDLPSTPAPICNLGFNPTDDEQKDAVRDAISKAAYGLWSWLPSFNVKTPIAPGEWVPLVLERIAGGLDNIVAKLLEDAEFKVLFGFEVTVDGVTSHPVHRVSGDPVNGDAQCVADSDPNTASPANLAASYADTAVPRSIGPEDRKSVSVRLRPKLVPHEGHDPARDNSHVTLQLVVSVVLPGYSVVLPAGADVVDNTPIVFDDIPIGPPITLEQQALAIPTLAVFFTGASCGTRPLFVLPGNTGIPDLPDGMHWDMRGQSDGTDWLETMHQLRGKLLGVLTLAHEVIDVVRYFYHPSWLDWLTEVIEKSRARSEFVIDTTGRLDDLGQSVYEGHPWPPGPDTFGRRIESVYLVGPPFSTSGISFHCYTGLAGTGSELTLKVPEDQFVAAFPDLRDLTEEWKVDSVTVPPPEYTETSPPPHHVWGGTLASIRVVEQPEGPP